MNELFDIIAFLALVSGFLTALSAFVHGRQGELKGATHFAGWSAILVAVGFIALIISRRIQ